MKRFHRPLFALLLSLLLLGSQQAAFAHLLGHMRGGAPVATQYQGDHGSFDGAAETCIGCIAAAAQGASAPPPAPAWRIATFNDVAADGAAVVCAPRRAFAGALARAPPSVL